MVYAEGRAPGMTREKCQTGAVCIPVPPPYHEGDGREGDAGADPRVRAHEEVQDLGLCPPQDAGGAAEAGAAGRGQAHGGSRGGSGKGKKHGIP